MRILLKVSLTFLTLFFLTYTLGAQNYKAAIGARLGSPLSASFKTFVSDENAFEIYVGFRGYSSYNWISVNGAYQKHNPLDDLTDGLSWYYGAGAGIYFWNYDFSRDFSSTTIGVQGYAGLDYKFENTPLNISVDWIPTFFVGNSFFTGFGAGYGSLAIRYTFKE